MKPEQTKQARYERLYEQLSLLLQKSPNLEAQMATVCAVIYHKISYVFWAGFYLVYDQNNLYVGPYQGPLACQELTWPKGVCWSAILNNEAVIVEDVNKFPGHIACDSRSKSEIVIPLTNPVTKKPAGVFDVDSTLYSAFDQYDLEGLRKILALLRYEIR